MSPYASELAFARLDALRTLIDAMSEAETPDEKRRCAVAIFSAPDPCELDDEIELVDDDDDDDDDENDDEDKDDEEPDDEEPDDDQADDEESDNPSDSAPTPRVSDAVEKARESPESCAALTPQHPPGPSVPSAPSPHAAARSLPSPSPSSTPPPFLPAPTTPASKLTATAGTTQSIPRAAPT